jgi:hypothetical protein
VKRRDKPTINVGKGLGVLRDASQHSVHPTGGSRRVFRQFAWLKVGSVKTVLPRPAHPRVTHTVGWLTIKRVIT